MPTLTLRGSPTFGGDSSCTIDGADRVQGGRPLVDADFASRDRPLSSTRARRGLPCAPA